MSKKLVFPKKFLYLITTVFAILFLINSCKKDSKSTTEPPVESKETGPVGNIGVAQGDIILQSNTPELVMALSEKTILTINQLSSNLNDRNPTGIIFSSSNSSIATVSSSGEVKSIATGTAIITATDSKGNKVMVSVSVKKEGLESLNEPVFVGFSSPLLIIDKEKQETIKPVVLNRLGQKLDLPYKIVLQTGNEIKEVTDNDIKNYPADNTYTVSVKVGDKKLIGTAPGIVVTPSNSKLSSIKPGIIGVNLDWGRYPVFFNKNGLQSETIIGLVQRVIPTTVNGKVELVVSFKEEEVNVETENNDVISANKSTIKSVKAGLGKWRVAQENFIGPWNNSQVFYDFSGDWICSNNKKGYSIKMKVPEVKPKVIHRGVKGTLSVEDIYEIRAGWYVQTDRAKTQFTDLVTKVVSSISDADIGPGANCTICSLPTELLKKDWSHGELETKYDKTRGGLVYISDNEFMLNDGTLTGPKFQRGAVDFNTSTPSLVPTVSSFSPLSGQEGNTVTISGTNFIGTTGISFGGTAASSFTVVNSTTITAVIGKGSTGSLTINTPNGTATKDGFTFNKPSTETAGRGYVSIKINGKTVNFESATSWYSFSNNNEWGMTADSLKAQKLYYQLFFGGAGKPAVGTYPVDRHGTFNKVQLNFYEPINGAMNIDYYTFEDGGTVTITKLDKRMVGTITGVKGYSRKGYSDQKEATLSGTFDVPYSESLK